MERDIRVWGTRELFPNTNVFCNEYGGDTCCLSYETSEAFYVFDAGSGLYRFGESVKDSAKPILIFISSLSADRIMGLLSFAPLAKKGRQIYIYLRKTAEFGDRSGLDVLNNFCGYPYGQCDIDKRGAEVMVSEIFSGDEIAINEDCGNVVKIGVVAGKNATYYSLSDDITSFSYVIDSLSDEENDNKIIEFSAGKKYMFSSDIDMFQLSKQGIVGTVVLMQYPVDLEDEDLFSIEREAKRTQEGVVFARGGMIIKV